MFHVNLGLYSLCKIVKCVSGSVYKFNMFVCCMFAVVPDSPSLTWPTMSQIQYPSSILKPLGLRASSVMHGLMYDWLPTKPRPQDYRTKRTRYVDYFFIVPSTDCCYVGIFKMSFVCIIVVSVELV